MHQAVLDSNSVPDGPTVVKNAQHDCVPLFILHHRLHGRSTRWEGHINQQLISGEESEEGLVDMNQ